MISLMRTILTASLLTLALSSTVLSGTYDGLYFIGNSSCDPNMVMIDTVGYITIYFGEQRWAAN